MYKVATTYFFAIAFGFNLMAPALSSWYSIVNGDTEQYLSFDFVDSENEENEEKGENETKDHKEKEKTEDEKLKQQSDIALIEYYKNTLKAQSTESNNAYKNIAKAVVTPPPRG